MLTIFLLMMKGRPHIGVSTIRHYLAEVVINLLEWPARSPYLNRIEHVWDIVG